MQGYLVLFFETWGFCARFLSVRLIAEGLCVSVGMCACQNGLSSLKEVGFPTLCFLY